MKCVRSWFQARTIEGAVDTLWPLLLARQPIWWMSLSRSHYMVLHRPLITEAWLARSVCLLAAKGNPILRQFCGSCLLRPITGDLVEMQSSFWPVHWMAHPRWVVTVELCFDHGTLSTFLPFEKLLLASRGLELCGVFSSFGSDDHQHPAAVLCRLPKSS